MAPRDGHAGHESSAAHDFNNTANNHPAFHEDLSLTNHKVHIDGADIPYEAAAGTMLLNNEKDEPAALMFYTAYRRTDVDDSSQRPVAFIYNGGPGSSSLWLHMGALGPRRVETADAGPTPPPPYNVTDNPYSLLDKADLVFIDPVGTGFSKAVGAGKDKDFWGVDQDTDSLAQFIEKYVSRNNRWNSPKFLIGESYGTFRSAALANKLQSEKNMAVNGVALISSVLDMASIDFPPGSDQSYIFYLPSYAAAAWYHNAPEDRHGNLEDFIQQAREFAAGEYATALMKGSHLSESEKADIAGKLAHFTGLNEDYLVNANLRVSLSQFMAELQRDKKQVTGRFDSRFSGPTSSPLNSDAYQDPSSDAITSAFATAFNAHIRNNLEFKPDTSYNVLNYRANAAWDWKHKGTGSWSSPNVQNDLAEAMIANPHLQIEVENGYFDMATPFFATEYTMSHLGLPPELEKNITMNYYGAGHMMYNRQEDLVKLKENLAAFIDRASGSPAPKPDIPPPSPAP